MAETGAVFGGEHSGHYYFADNFRADSGMLAMLVLLQVISESGRKLSEIRSEVEPYCRLGRDQHSAWPIRRLPWIGSRRSSRTPSSTISTG